MSRERSAGAAMSSVALEERTPAYAVAQLREVTMGTQIVKYLQHIDATLEPYGGRFLIHGGAVHVLEGAWRGDLIVIAFPDRQRARAWYESAEYQAILGLRTGSSVGDVILVEGVPDGHHATDVLAA